MNSPKQEDERETQSSNFNPLGYADAHQQAMQAQTQRIMRLARDIEIGDCVNVTLTAERRKELADEMRAAVDAPSDNPTGCCPCEQPLNHLDGCHNLSAQQAMQGLQARVEDLEHANNSWSYSYDNLAKRANRLQYLVGSIAELLRKDMTNE